MTSSITVSRITLFWIWVSCHRLQTNPNQLSVFVRNYNNYNHLNIFFKCVSSVKRFEPNFFPDIVFELIMKGNRICYLKISLFGIRIILEWLLLRNSSHRRSSENWIEDIYIYKVNLHFYGYLFLYQPYPCLLCFSWWHLINDSQLLFSLLIYLILDRLGRGHLSWEPRWVEEKLFSSPTVIYSTLHHHHSESY